MVYLIFSLWSEREFSVASGIGAWSHPVAMLDDATTSANHKMGIRSSSMYEPKCPQISKVHQRPRVQPNGPGGTSAMFVYVNNPYREFGIPRPWLQSALKPGLNQTFTGPAMAERLACSPPTRANRVQSPAGSLPDFRKWESCWTMSLVGGFSRGSPVSPRSFIPALFHSHLNHPYRMSDEALGVRVIVALIAHSLSRGADQTAELPPRGILLQAAICQAGLKRRTSWLAK
ncbi:hypothetical protein PR048_033303 [Dryococelus australis]|uniref:Uncharacterized protein n=1 Tax=Dryococelus australis TaxID=614101 RepID=A0ABQ9G2R2_9NEOP|nr:hypothetical protein PR048_033303 [Dryococelus australis]